MARRYFNWKLLVVILIATMMLGVTAYGLRKWQKGQKSGLAYEKGIKAFDEHKWDEVASHLGRYISSNPEDIEMLHKYATAQMNRRPVGKSNINQAISAYRMILQVDNSEVEATKKISEMYLQMRLSGEAELILSKFPDIESNPDLGTLLAKAMALQKKFEDVVKEGVVKEEGAVTKLNAIIKAHPEHIPAYELMAQFVPYQLAGQMEDKTDEQKKKIILEQMEKWINDAVGKNPSSAKAYMMRADYRRRLNDREGFDSDLAKVQEFEITAADDKLMLAKLLAIAGKLDEAEKILEDIAADDPRNLGMWVSWVDLAKRTNSKDKVLKVVKNARKALERDPWDFMSTAAEVYLQCNKIEEAKECISKLKDKKMLPLAVARFEAVLTDIDKKSGPFESVKAWREVIDLIFRTPGFSVPPKDRMSLALAYARADDSAAAVREMSEILVDNPKYWQAHLWLAKNASRNGNFRKSAESAQRVIQLLPAHVEAKYLYVQAQVQQLSQLDPEASPPDPEAIKLQIAELEKIPSMAIQAELLRFRMAIGKKDFEAAEKIADKLKSDYPDDIRAAMAMANLNLVQDKLDETIVLLEQMVKDFPKATDPVQYLVSILASKDQQERGIELLNEAIARNDNPAAKLNFSFILADFYLRWNRQNELYELLKALDLDEKHPKNIQIKTRLLMTQKFAKDPAAGQSIVDQIKAIVGENSWLWRYHQSRLWYLSEDFKSHYTEIVSLMKRNLLENPTDQASRLLLAGSYFKAGDVQVAFSMYREAFDREPDNLKVIIPMVSALYQAGQFELADEIMSKVSAKTLQNPQLSRLKVDSHIRQGDYSTASELLRSSLLAISGSNSDKLTLAMLEMEQKNYSEAAKMLDGLKDTVSEPGFLRSVVAAQIQLSVQQNNYDEAIRICDKLVEEDSVAASLLIRARMYYTIKNNERALVDYNMAIQKEPENSDTWVARSRFYASTNEMQKAIDDMVKAISVGETNLAKALSLVKSIQEATEDTSDALSDAETDVKKQKNTLVQIQRQTILLMLSSGIEDAVNKGRELLAKALTENPGEVELMMINARLLFSRGTVPSRNESAEILVEITRKTSSNVEAWSLLGQIALARQQYDKAIAYAQRGLLSRPNDRRLMLLKARGESGRSPAFAIATLKALYDLDPANLDNAIYLADTYSQSEQTRKAVELLEAQLKKIEDEQDSLRCRVALAQARYRDGKTEQAAKDFALLMESKDVSVVTLATYTNLLLGSRDYEECFKQVSDWIAKNPEDSLEAIGVIERLVNASAGNDKVMKLAISTFEKIIEGHPDAPNALQGMAVLYQMVEQNDKAISLYERVHDIRPDDLIVLNNLAWAYCQEKGNYQQALEMANRGLKKAPEYIDLIDTRGFIYSKLGQFDKAIIDFQKCLELYPGTNPAIISTRLHLAKAFEKTGQKDMAIKELNTILLLKQNLSASIREMKKADFKEALDLLNTLSKRG
ncbi:MAG: tetratricopeptide repeat protein [Planctomycetes bacterium]|nr:tetratricopeptide repeat protein [Planctomycetota bacterium]